MSVNYIKSSRKSYILKFIGRINDFCLGIVKEGSSTFVYCGEETGF